MKSYLKTGKTMSFTAPTGGVTVDVPVLIGGLFVIPALTALVGVQFEGQTEGVFTLSKATGEGTLVEGAPLWWDATNLRVSIDHTVGLPIGTVGTGGAVTGDTTVQVRLNGVTLAGRVLTIRKRLAISAVNAGATLLPALVGLKYRMVSAKAIAIAGAVAAVTTVDILATQSAGSVKLVAFAQASLTRSAVLTAGGTGAAVQADGASFVACDVNTAITVGKTGSDITTATSIDFDFTYVLEA